MELPFRVWPRLTGAAVTVYPGLGAFTAWDRAMLVCTEEVDGYIDGDVIVPADVGTITEAAIAFEISSTPTSGTTRWSVALAAIANGESFDPASLTSETAQDITVPGTTLLRKLVRFPTSGGVGTTIAAGDIVIARFFHEGAHANSVESGAIFFSNPRLLLTLS